MTSKIGELNLGKFKTEIHATEDTKAILKKEKISTSFLIPPAYLWYDGELLETIDENGDGKPDDRFGKNFKIIYLTENENIKEFEQDALIRTKTTIKNINLKYAVLKI